MDTGGSNRRAAFVEEFLRTEEINAVVSCSLPNSVGQAGTHHSFWYSISRINASRPQMVTFFFWFAGLGMSSQARGRDRTSSRN
jgi:hypothetical protein